MIGPNKLRILPFIRSMHFLNLLYHQNIHTHIYPHIIAKPKNKNKGKILQQHHLNCTACVDPERVAEKC